MHSFHRVIAIGLDGLEPSIVEPMLAAGELPALARIRARGGYGRLATTTPAQTPVAWSTFATGVNPGAHGIFDFVRRDPATYRAELGLSTYEQKSAWLPPRAVNLRRGIPLWERLARASVPCTVLRCPCTYPPDQGDPRVKLLAGVGVPDLRGGLGTGTFYTTDATAVARESERVVPLVRDGAAYRAHLVGPRHAPSRADLRLDFALVPDAAGRRAVLASDGEPRTLELTEGAWSPWLRVKFKAGLFQSVRGCVRFLLTKAGPTPELYATPLNFDPTAPMFPISAPSDYAAELARAVGTFHTTGMVEDTHGLSNGRFDEAAFLAHCAVAMREREAMLAHALDHSDAGFLYCLFDTPDRLAHMLWRHRESDHPANGPNGAGHRPELARAIEDHYQECDRVVGRVLERADESTWVVVLSDHGMGSFRRGVHLNSWLHAQGLLVLDGGHAPGDEHGDGFPYVDWDRTRAYALGLGGIYLNLRGREAHGIVAADDADALATGLARELSRLDDPTTGARAVRAVRTRGELYTGPYAALAPDLTVDFAAGYRVSWATGLGGVPAGLVEDNTKAWSGDHLVDPALVPGVLFSDQPLAHDGARMVDLAPTILAALGVPGGAEMEGRSLWR